MEAAANSLEVALPSPSDSPAKKPQRRRHRATKPQLLSRSRIDRRSNAAKVFDRLVSQIESDLGSRSELSAIEMALVEAFAGTYVTLDNLNTRLLLGQEIDLGEHAAAVSAMVRVASRLGLRRRPREVPSLSQYLAQLRAEKEAAAGTAEPATIDAEPAEEAQP